MTDQEQDQAIEELVDWQETIDERLDKLTSDLTLLKEHSTDLLQAMELTHERTNQMIDSINRHDETMKALQASQASLLASQVRTDEVIRNLSIRQARVEDNQALSESKQSATDEILNRVAANIDKLFLKQAETDEIVNRIAKNVDRYLNARLNGGANN